MSTNQLLYLQCICYMNDKYQTNPKMTLEVMHQIAVIMVNKRLPISRRIVQTLLDRGESGRREIMARGLI